MTCSHAVGYLLKTRHPSFSTVAPVTRIGGEKGPSLLRVRLGLIHPEGVRQAAGAVVVECGATEECVARGKLVTNVRQGPLGRQDLALVTVDPTLQGAIEIAGGQVMDTTTQGQTKVEAGIRRHRDSRLLELRPIVLGKNELSQLPKIDFVVLQSVGIAWLQQYFICAYL